MIFTWWRKGSWQTLALEWPGHGATRPPDIAARHPCCGPLHFPPERARTCKDGSSAESWQCGEDRHVLCSVLYHLMVTGGEALPPSQHSCAREVASDDVCRGEDIQPR